MKLDQSDIRCQDIGCEDRHECERFLQRHTGKCQTRAHGKFRKVVKMNERILDICHAAISEYERATSLYPEFHSCHEGYAVIKEEVDELWDAIKAEKGVTATENQVDEVIQIMAMCIKYIMSLGGDKNGG